MKNPQKSDKININVVDHINFACINTPSRYNYSSSFVSYYSIIHIVTTSYDFKTKRL